MSAMPDGSLASSIAYTRAYALKGVMEDLSAAIAGVKRPPVGDEEQDAELSEDLFRQLSCSTSPQSVLEDLSDDEDLPELASRLDESCDNGTIEEAD
jgi:hypothetical protein